MVGLNLVLLETHEKNRTGAGERSGFCSVDLEHVYYMTTWGILRHGVNCIVSYSALVLYITATIVACQEQANIPPVKNKTDWLIPADDPHT